jgi:hypothetical protein
LVKNIEWRPEMAAGLTSQSPRAMPTPPIKAIVEKLDHHHPGWSARFAHSVESVASKAVTSAWRGVESAAGPIIAQLGGRALQRAGMSTMAGLGRSAIAGLLL